MYTRLIPAAVWLTSAVAMAQSPEVPQPSPKASVSQRVGITDLALEYSSPGVKGRKIWGTVVPFDTVWRAGANAATKLTSSTDFTFGDVQVKAGSYSLHALPTKTTWTVMLNSDPNAGPTQYDKAKDVARVTVKPAAVPMRERLNYSFNDTTDEQTRLDLEWEKLRISVPIKVDTKTMVAANIDKAIGEAWRPHFVAARWLLESGGDLDKALSYADQSIEVKPTWWNNWIKAQVLAKKGKPADAVSAGEKAQELGKGDYVYDTFFKAEVEKTVSDLKKKS